MFQDGHPLAGQRVGAGVAVVLRDGEAELEVLDLLEEGQGALAADPGLGEETGTGLIGRGFLGAAVGEQFAHRRLLAGGEDAGAGFARAGSHRRRAEQQRQDGDAGGDLIALADADDVAAGDVAELVRDHALDLVDIVGRSDRAGMDVDDLAAGDERVRGVVLDHHDLDIARAEPGRLDDRPGHVAEQGLGLGIAQDRLRQRRPAHDREAEHEQHQQPGGERAAAPDACSVTLSHRLPYPDARLNP